MSDGRPITRHKNMIQRHRPLHDRRHAFLYLIGVEVAGALLAKGDLIAEARERLAKVYGAVPEHRDARRLWKVCWTGLQRSSPRGFCRNTRRATTRARPARPSSSCTIVASK